MKSTQFLFRTFAATLTLLLTGALAHATTVTGTVTDKTTGKPAVGDPVVLVDVQASMGEAAHATTDGKGHYSLVEPGSGPYLVRVTHQGAGYFMAAPQGGDAGRHHRLRRGRQGAGRLHRGRLLRSRATTASSRSTSASSSTTPASPPTTQWSAKSFEVTLPADAVVDSTRRRSRPNGLPTTINLEPDGPKGHYAFNFPIQPDDGDKDTLFQFAYHVPYASAKYAFKAQVSLPADNFAVLLPKSMTFTAASGDAFKCIPQDPSIQTLLLKNVAPGKQLEFTISGNGSMPREQQGTPGGQQPAGMGGQDASGAAAQGNGPGGGIGKPDQHARPADANTSGGSWAGWACCWQPRRLSCCASRPAAPGAASSGDAGVATYPAFGSPAAKHSQLLSVLKEEMFALESEKIHGSVGDEEYTRVKAALETVLKRALNRK